MHKNEVVYALRVMFLVCPFFENQLTFEIAFRAQLAINRLVLAPNFAIGGKTAQTEILAFSEFFHHLY